jgi:hypothetical protein
MGGWRRLGVEDDQAAGSHQEGGCAYCDHHSDDVPPASKMVVVGFHGQLPFAAISTLPVDVAPPSARP